MAFPLAGLLACVACAAEPEPAGLSLMDVAGDDCTASVLVYDKPPAEATPGDLGTPFINDGCWGKRIFLGIDGERRELTRDGEVSLGTGGAYSDGEYRVLVTRGRLASRVEEPGETELWCVAPQSRSYSVVYETDVRIWTADRSWTVKGALHDMECGA